MIEFFLSMEPPTITHQEHKIAVRDGKPIVYEQPELKAARQKLVDHLAKYIPEAPCEGAVELVVKWLFPVTGKHHPGEYKTSKPDTDNLQKMLKDCMTRCRFWIDDAQVSREITEKFWNDLPGIYIRITELEDR